MARTRTRRPATLAETAETQATGQRTDWIQQPQKLLLPVPDALPLMGGISLRTFQREVAAERIRTVHLGRRVLVPYAELVRYVRWLCDEQGVPLDDMALAG